MKFRKTRFIIFGARSWDDYRPNYVVLIFLPLKKFDSEHNLYEASFFEEVQLRPQDSENRGRLHIKTVCCYF